ncbi:MAG: hypothetical protein JWN38_901 [Candidatus Saccharibacteria bacterium]|nr:hypothetical protein [Candidatus Saccharibacteria bacterium]
MAPHLFDRYRVVSATTFSLPAGLEPRLAPFGPGFTLDHLQQLDAATIGLYVDEHQLHERFILQGGNGPDTWKDIKPLSPLPVPALTLSSR